MVNSLGQIRGSLKAIMLMIRSKVMESIYGQMGGIIKEIGMMASRMVLAIILILRELLKSETGTMVKKLSGLNDFLSSVKIYIGLLFFYYFILIIM